MYRALLFCLLLLHAFPVFSQFDPALSKYNVISNATDTIYYSRGWLKTNYKDNANYFRPPAQKDGDRYKLSFYWMNGLVHITGSYFPEYVNGVLNLDPINAKKDGWLIHYNEKGKIIAEVFYIMGYRAGECKFYYDNGSLRSTESHYDGQPYVYITKYDSASNKVWAEGGAIKKIEPNTENYMYNGGWTFYNPENSSVIKTLIYTMGNIHGPCKYYDSASSKKIAEGDLRLDRRDGEWKYYDAVTGNLTGTYNYSKGSLNGVTKQFSPKTGKLKLLSFYEDGKCVGNWKVYFNDSDSLMAEISFIKDKGYATYYDSITRRKVLEGKVTFNGRNGKWTRYYSDADKVAGVENYKDNMLDGELVAYDTAGNKLSEGKFIKGRKYGTFVYYEANSQWLEMNYKNDTLTGNLRSYYPSGKIKRKELYVKGAIKEARCYDEAGKEIDYKPLAANPVFDGDIMTYIGENLKYPQEARDAGIEGKVTVGFNVSESGIISDPQIINSIDAKCDAEAIRLVSQMPPWRPAEIDGKPFQMYQTLPVVFWIH